MEIGENLQKLFIGLIDSSNEVGELVFLEVLTECAEALIHEFIDFDGIVVFVAAVDGEADGADQSSVFTGAVNAHESGVLAM